MDMKAKGIVKDFIEDFIEDTAKENNKGVIIIYNTYINKGKRNIGFRALILAI